MTVLATSPAELSVDRMGVLAAHLVTALGWGLLVLVLLDVCIGVISSLRHGDRDYLRHAAPRLAARIVLTPLVTVLLIRLGDRLSTLATAPIPDPYAPTPPAPPPHPAGSAVPWAPLGIAAAGLLATTAVVALTVLALRRRARSRATAAARDRRLDLLHARHDRVQHAWGAFETDLLAVFQAPLLTDVTVPQTAAFTSASGHAHHLRDLIGDKHDHHGGQDLVLDRYDDAVRQLEDTWTIALAHARQVGHGLLPPAERRTLQRAVVLLRKALHDGTPESERQTTYQQALRLVRSLVTVPTAAVLSIERTHRLALAAHATGSADGADQPVTAGTPTTASTT